MRKKTPAYPNDPFQIKTIYIVLGGVALFIIPIVIEFVQHRIIDGELNVASAAAIDTLEPTQRAAAELILRRGGTMTCVDNRVVSVSLTSCDFSDEDAQSLTALKSLRRLSLRNTQLTDNGVNALKDLKQLTELLLSGTAVTDNSIDVFIRLDRLEFLELRNTQISPNGSKLLRSRLSDCRILD